MYWLQNTRLVYWGMLASGDWDMMGPLFRMYRDALPVLEARSGACFYLIPTFGLEARVKA
jgi:hypothetical protein